MSGKRWSQQELDFVIAHYNNDMTPRSIADFLGRSYQAVQHKAMQTNVQRDWYWTQEQDDYIRDNYSSTLSTLQIAEILGKTERSVIGRASMLGIKRSQYWSDSEKQYVKEHYQTDDTKDMATHLDKNVRNINAMAAVIGISKGYNPVVLPVNHDYFDYLGANQYYVLGFFAADGCIGKAGNSYSIHFAQVGRDIIDKLKTEFESEHSISGSKQPNGKMKYQFSFTSQKTYDFMCSFFDMDVRQKSLDLKWPKNLPIEYARDFMRGLIDGDGSLMLRKRTGQPIVAFCSGSLAMVNSFINNINSHTGIDTKLKKQRIWRIAYCSLKAVCVAHYLYHDAELYLERKYQKYLDMLPYLNRSGLHYDKLSSQSESLFSDILPQTA